MPHLASFVYINEASEAKKIRREAPTCNKLQLARKCKHTRHSTRFGENHPNAVLTQADVDAMREMHEEYPLGHPDHLGSRKLQKIFNIKSRDHLVRILRYEIWVKHV